MPTITVKDGTEIYYKDWGTGQPLVFHHGWPLSSDDWDTQLMFFLNKGYRVIAADRRGHGRSSQSATGHDMDTYVADALELADHLDLKDAVHIGHSTGGGVAIRYAARAAKGRTSKVVLISAVTPLMLQTPANPDGVPMSVFDEIREGTATNRAQYFQDFTLPFYGYNRPGAQVKQGIRDNWWRQGMSGGANAHYFGIAAFAETDFTDDLKSVDLPVLVLHGEDDQIVPFPISGAKSIKLLQHGRLISYPGFRTACPPRRPPPSTQTYLPFCKNSL